MRLPFIPALAVFDQPLRMQRNPCAGWSHTELDTRWQITLSVSQYNRLDQIIQYRWKTTNCLNLQEIFGQVENGSD
jgi:hypothetical protein